jgi:hypothetical protein
MVESGRYWRQNSDELMMSFFLVSVCAIHCLADAAGLPDGIFSNQKSKFG